MLRYLYKGTKHTKYVHLKLEFRNDALVKTQIVLLEVTNLNTLTLLSTILWFNIAILRIYEENYVITYSKNPFSFIWNINLK